MNSFEVLSFNLQANMQRIEQLLNTEGIENQFIKDKWLSLNKNNVELRQRLKLLRKEALLLEKEIK